MCVRLYSDFVEQAYSMAALMRTPSRTHVGVLDPAIAPLQKASQLGAGRYIEGFTPPDWWEG